MKPSLLVLSGVLLLAAAGCASTPSSRIQSAREVYNSYPMEVQEKIASGQVDVGFTTEQVRMALGKPDRVASRTTPDGTSEVWSYRDKGPRFSVGLGLGVGGGGGSTRVGTGVGVSTGGRDYDDEKTRVIFDQRGQVTSVEQVQER
ncbi:MAG TPA: hypothetical protein VGD88_16845 [Opitutaceae bacterium]